MKTQNKNNILPIAMMFALFAMISFVTGLSNPMGVIVKNQDGIQNWMSQLGNFANFFAYLFMGLPAGLILKRKGYKFQHLPPLPLVLWALAFNSILDLFRTKKEAISTSYLQFISLVLLFLVSLCVCWIP